MPAEASAGFVFTRCTKNVRCYVIKYNILSKELHLFSEKLINYSQSMFQRAAGGKREKSC